MGFAVIEGLDGSGKSTQLDLLCKHFEREKIPYNFMHFPRIDSSLFGSLIGMFLRGELGSIENVSPYMTALLYAGNRNDAKKEISQWLSEGRVVIADRYVYSNIAYQCAKLKTEEEKNQLKQWILYMEYSYYSIPRPGVNIFLDVPMDFTRQNLQKARTGNDRNYLGGKKDIHEEKIEFQEKVRQSYLELAEKEEDMKVLKCFSENGEIMEAREISSRIISLLKSKKITG